MNTPSKRRLNLVSVLLIQMAVIVYTMSSVCSKMAGQNAGSITLFGITINALSWKGVFWMVGEVFVLFVYAILWQQIIKRFDLSLVYANRAFSIFWSFLWSILLFHESIRPANVIGILMVFFGILIVNSDRQAESL